MRRLALVLTALCAAVSLRAATVSPVQLYALTCEHLTNPTGIGNQHPRLSWKLRSSRTGEVQTAWEIRAASSRTGLENGAPDLWESGKVASDQSVLVPWAGKSLASRSFVFWQVRVWDKDGQPTAWSPVAHFELGLLDPATEWQGQWITANLPRYDFEHTALAKTSWISAGSRADQEAAVRLAIDIPAGAAIRTAYVDAAADGRIAVYVNGHRTEEGFTSLTSPIHAEVWNQLQPGRNVIAIGSTAVRRNIRHDRGQPGRNAIAARVLITLKDGRRLVFHTDHSWKAAIAPKGDWYSPSFDASSWSRATVLAPYPDQPSKYCNTTVGPGRYLRKDFDVAKPIARARLYATALGVYEASINGHRVSHNQLEPGWTDYTKRVMVQTYDVTRLIHPGRNAVGAVLSDGWYAGRLGWMGLAQYGKIPSFNAQLEITYTDGSRAVIATNGSWKAGPGEIVGADEQWGEILDARKADTNWARPSFDNSAWTHAVVEKHTVALDPQLGPPVRALMERAPEKITRWGDHWIVDFGQNLVGHVRLTASGPAGDTITVRHAEMLKQDGSLYTENLRTALATDTFILNGKGRETFEPRFTFHGFRYVEITGFPGTLKPSDLRAIVVGSANPPTGTFTSSSEPLNRLYKNIVWSQRGNFLSVPTDCPQRDERLGWMGDAQVFAPTAARNANVAAFFTKWMVDVDDGQTANGAFSDVSPRVNRPQPAMPVWGDAGVIIPWVMYHAYGDKAFLADNYAHMVRWVDFSRERARNLILKGGVGDHLAPVRTPTQVVDTAYFAHSAFIVSQAAQLLGKTEDAARYGKLFDAIKAAFDHDFVADDGKILGDTQTAYILALQFNLLPENLRADAAKRLAQKVEESRHLTTGFVGNGLICPALTAIGRSDLAWKLVLTNTYPSWLFSVKNGATTIWERWDGWTPERGFQNSSMNSFNHYSLGSVGAWLYSGAAGIRQDPQSPGYKHFILAPQFTTRLSHLKATLNTPYGLISSAWKVNGNAINYTVTIPPNTTATLLLSVPTKDVQESGHPINLPASSATKLPIAAGSYQFTIKQR